MCTYQKSFFKRSCSILKFCRHATYSLCCSEGSDETALSLQDSQGGQSHGQHDWVHGFPEPVKSFITFLILSQILCGKVQKNPHIFLQSFSLVCCTFPDYLDQLKKKRKILCDWVHTSVGRSYLENCSKPRRNFYTVLCRKI